MAQSVSQGARRSVGVGMVALALAVGPATAQSMFEQMPTAPGDAPAAAPSAVATPSMATMPTTPLGVPQAQSVAPHAGVDCQSIQKVLAERKALVAKANAASNSKQKMTPQQACNLFGQLQSNGVTGIKWITQNREWCSIPDSFSEGFKADNARVSQIRGKICTVAAQATKMEAQAREGGGGGLLGGPGLTGSFRMPQGAL